MNITHRDMAVHAARLFDVSVHSIYGPSQQHRVSMARQACWLAYWRRGRPGPRGYQVPTVAQVANWFARDRATIKWGIAKAKMREHHVEGYREKVAELTALGTAPVPYWGLPMKNPARVTVRVLEPIAA